MRPFTIADVHVHSEYSHDSNSRMLHIRDVARRNELLLAITDHNRIGGSLAAKSMKIPVIPAIEITTKKLKDFLIYFYDHDNLQDFYERYVRPKLDPGIIWGSRTLLTEEELLDAAAEYECFVSLAHPYCPIPKRSAGLPMPIMRRIPGIEVMNFSMSMRANAKAAKLCDTLGKVHTAGSDAHVPQAIGAVTMRGFGQTPQEFLAEITQGTAMVVGAPRRVRDVKDKVFQFLATKVQG